MGDCVVYLFIGTSPMQLNTHTLYIINRQGLDYQELYELLCQFNLTEPNLLIQHGLPAFRELYLSEHSCKILINNKLLNVTL